MCVSYDDLLKFIRETRAKSEQLWKERNDYATNAPILSEGTILDEEQTVRWNREEVARRNNSRKGKLAAYMTKINQCNRDIDQKIMDYLRSEFEFSEAVARIVFNEAYERGHHAGHEEVASYAHSCGLFAEQILDAADV